MDKENDKAKDKETFSADEEMPAWADKLAEKIVSGIASAMGTETETFDADADADVDDDEPETFAEPDDLEDEPEADEEKETFSKAGATKRTATKKAPPKRKEKRDGVNRFAKLEAELASMRIKESRRAKREKLESLISGARSELAEYEIDGELESKIQRFAKLGKQPLDDFVEFVKANVDPDPPETFEEFSQQQTGDPEEVQRFAAKGAEPLRQARAAYPHYQAYLAAGGSANFETYMGAQQSA